MDIFDAFPHAIVSEQFEIGKADFGTEIGTVFSEASACDVVIDEGTYATTGRTPDVPYMTSDILIYARPQQMPTLVTAKLTNGYIWHDKINDLYYEIREASLGKNQETGEVEHVEFLLRPTEIAFAEENSDE